MSFNDDVGEIIMKQVVIRMTICLGCQQDRCVITGYMDVRIFFSVVFDTKTVIYITKCLKYNISLKESLCT